MHRRAWGVVLVLAAAACGGRTPLRTLGSSSTSSGDPTTSSSGVGGGGAGGTGAGGLGGGGAGGSGGAGGAGGAPGDCVVELPVAELAGTGFYAQYRPTLVRSSADGETATLAAAWQIPEGPGEIPPAEIRHTSFQPWSSWPADGLLGPSFLADLDAGESFATAPAPGGFALAFANTLAPPPEPSLYFMPGLVPGSGAIPPSTLVLSTFARVHFAALGAGAHLVGVSVGGPAPDVTEVARIEGNGSVTLLNALGCSGDAGIASGAPVGDHFVVAFSAAHGVAAPGCPIPNPGPAEHVLVARVGAGVQIVSELDPGPGSIAALHAVPAVDGAWIVWSRFSGSSHPVTIARVDGEGQLLFGPIQTSIPTDPQWLGAAALGDRLALGWFSHEENLGSRVEIAVLDAAGQLVGEGSLSLGAFAQGPVSLLGSPSGGSLLASWAQTSPESFHAKVARFDCSFAGAP